MAYQIAFDLYENATQQFLTSVIDKLRIAIPLITPDADEDNETKNTVSLHFYFWAAFSLSVNFLKARGVYWGRGAGGAHTPSPGQMGCRGGAIFVRDIMKYTLWWLYVIQYLSIMFNIFITANCFSPLGVWSCVYYEKFFLCFQGQVTDMTKTYTTQVLDEYPPSRGGRAPLLYQIMLDPYLLKTRKFNLVLQIRHFRWLQWMSLDAWSSITQSLLVGKSHATICSLREAVIDLFNNSAAILNFEHIAMHCGLSRVILLF